MEKPCSCEVQEFAVAVEDGIVYTTCLNCGRVTTEQESVVEARGQARYDSE